MLASVTNLAALTWAISHACATSLGNPRAITLIYPGTDQQPSSTAIATLLNAVTYAPAASPTPSYPTPYDPAHNTINRLQTAAAVTGPSLANILTILTTTPNTAPDTTLTTLAISTTFTTPHNPTKPNTPTLPSHNSNPPNHTGDGGPAPVPWTVTEVPAPAPKAATDELLSTNYASEIKTIHVRHGDTQTTLNHSAGHPKHPADRHNCSGTRRLDHHSPIQRLKCCTPSYTLTPQTLKGREQSTAHLSTAIETLINTTNRTTHLRPETGMPRGPRPSGSHNCSTPVRTMSGATTPRPRDSPSLASPKYITTNASGAQTSHPPLSIRTKTTAVFTTETLPGRATTPLNSTDKADRGPPSPRPQEPNHSLPYSFPHRPKPACGGPPYKACPTTLRVRAASSRTPPPLTYRIAAPLRPEAAPFVPSAAEQAADDSKPKELQPKLKFKPSPAAFQKAAARAASMEDLNNRPSKRSTSSSSMTMSETPATQPSADQHAETGLPPPITSENTTTLPEAASKQGLPVPLPAHVLTDEAFAAASGQPNAPPDTSVTLDGDVEMEEAEPEVARAPVEHQTAVDPDECLAPLALKPRASRRNKEAGGSVVGIPGTDGQDNTLELRVYDCRRGTLDRATSVHEVFTREVLSKINLDSKGNPIPASHEDYIDTSPFSVKAGDTGDMLNVHTVSIRFKPNDLKDHALDGSAMGTLERLRARVRDMNYPAKWASRKDKDNQATGVFVFSRTELAAPDLSASDCSRWITDFCKTAQLDFDTDSPNIYTGNPKHLTKYVRFRRPEYVQRMADYVRARPGLVTRGWAISYKPAAAIKCRNAATIATCEVHDFDEGTLEQELKGWEDRFNKDATRNKGRQDHRVLNDGRMDDGIFSISCSSLDLAAYICEQIPEEGGTPYEFAYHLNGNQLKPKKQVLAIKKAQAARDQEQAMRTIEDNKAITERLERRLDALQSQANERDSKIDAYMSKSDNNMATIFAVGTQEASINTQTTVIAGDVSFLRYQLQDAVKQRDTAKDNMYLYESKSDDAEIKRWNLAQRQLERAERAIREVEATIAAKEAKAESIRQGSLRRQLAADERGWWTINGKAITESMAGEPISTMLDGTDDRLRITEHGTESVSVTPDDTLGSSHPSAQLSPLEAATGQAIAIALTLIRSSTSEMRPHPFPLRRPPQCRYTGCQNMNVLVFVLIALCLIPSAHASPGLLRMLTLNVNNMGNNWEKNHGIINIIRQAMPHVVILTETWQPVGAPLRLPVFKERGAFRITSAYATYFIPSIGSASNGVTLLINKAIAFTALPHTTITEGLGRVVAVDLTLPDLLGRATRCRLIGIYAPARPQGHDLGSFWKAVQQLTEIDHEWIVAGDFNAFLNPWEERGGTREPHYTRMLDDLRKAYRVFLHNTRGLDAWDQNRPVYIERDWTCRGHARPDAKKILDRFAYSHRIGLDSIRTLEEVDRTNHRPVAANFRIGAMTPAARDVLKNRAPPRLAPPKPQNAAEKYRLLNTKISNRLEGKPPPVYEPRTDNECDELLRYCDEVLTPAAESTFGRKRNGPVNPSLYNQHSKASDELARRKHETNRLIRAIDEGREEMLIEKEGEVQREITDMPGFEQARNDRQAMRELARQHRRKLERAYHNERREAARRTAQATQKGEFKDVLKSGRIKELFRPHEVTNPALLRKGQLTDHPATYASTPTARLETFTDYFERLYQPEELPIAAKPWLTSPAANIMRGKTAGPNALQWPILLTVPGLRTILARGNQRPSPGPDGWEKWVLRRCNDEFLGLVTNLLNYILRTNHFPERLRENYDSPLYKKKDPTQPENYRGVVYSQCLFAILSSHFAHTLQNFCWEKNLLPKTQIATQKGVQSGDLTMFLGEAHIAADLAGTTIYGIKRDHTKGFDLFHQSGFADAIDFYGLPETMLDFERARTSKAYLRIKSQDGIGKRDIVTSGQTKQGDAASPIKYTLAMGMLHHWLGTGGRLRAQNIAHVRTRNLQADVRHTAEDGAPLALLCVEAMDDSIWFAPSWEDLQKIVGLTEQFQAAYGVRTAWDNDEKTVCFVMGKTPTDCRGPRADGTVTFEVMGGAHKVPSLAGPPCCEPSFWTNGRPWTKYSAW